MSRKGILDVVIGATVTPLGLAYARRRIREELDGPTLEQLKGEASNVIDGADRFRSVHNSPEPA